MLRRLDLVGIFITYIFISLVVDKVFNITPCPCRKFVPSSHQTINTIQLSGHFLKIQKLLQVSLYFILFHCWPWSLDSWKKKMIINMCVQYNISSKKHPITFSSYSYSSDCISVSPHVKNNWTELLETFRTCRYIWCAGLTQTKLDLDL